MADNPTTFAVRDGGGSARSFIAGVDPSGNIIPHHAIRHSGGEVSPGNPLSVVDTAAATAIAVMQGAPGNGITAPTGAAGLIGWLSGIYAKLSGTLTVALSGALPAGSNAIGSVSVSNFPATMAVSDAAAETSLAAIASASRGPIASVFSTASEASHVLKASAGTLYAVQATATQTGFVMLFDSASVPADGAVTPRKVWQVSGPVTVDKAFSPPLAMSAGAVLVFSTTGPFVKTGAAAAHFSGEVA